MLKTPQVEDSLVKITGGELFVRRLFYCDTSKEHDDEKPVLVFLHDSLGCVETWRDFPERMCAAVACDGIVYDRLGYGQSSAVTFYRELDYKEHEADLVLGLLKELAIKKAILFGHSDGASISLIAAAKDAEKVVAVVSEAAHVFVEEITLKGIEEGKKAYERSHLKRKLEKYHGDKTDAVFWAWAATWLSPSFRDFNMEHFLEDIKCPVLVLQGERDEYGTLAQVESIAGQVSGFAQRAVLEGVRHSPHREATELVLPLVAEFIKANVQTG